MTDKETLKLALEALDMMIVPRSFQAQVRIKEIYETIEKELASEQPKTRTGNCLLTGVCAAEGHKIQAKQEQGEPDEFLLRGILASELKCWHRLNAEESQNLIDFVKNMGAKQEQGEPVAWGMQNDDGKIYDCITPDEHKRQEGEYTVPLYTTPQPKREQGEPVAYRYKMPVEDDHWVWNYCTYPDNKDDPRCEPLYTTPQQRPSRSDIKPLTDEQISDLWCKTSNTEFVTADTHVFAKAIEAAHGIKE